jgi:hypothetical protein
LITAIQPSLIVELGTHWGEAYFTFCQAVEEQGLSCLCYAVDHWQGDEHAGLYGEEVFDEVNDYNNRYYRQFSYLLRRSFDDALPQFADDSIDLLHIDGLHTYEAVSRDFRAWLPKIKDGGIILLHDISPRHDDFGVWRLWDEIKSEFADSFEFHHSWGLGVVAKGHISRKAALTEILFDGSALARENLRRHYVIYASHLENILGRFPLAAGRPAPANMAPDIRVQVFPYAENGYSEESCQVRPMRPGIWETLTFDFRVPIGRGPLRIDPGSEPAFVEVGDVLIHDGATGEIAWESRASSPERSISAAGTAGFPFDDARSFLVSLGGDPQILLAVPPELSGPARVSISLKIVPASSQAMGLFELVTSRLKDGIDGAEQQLTRQAEQHQQEVAALQQQREHLASDLAARAAQTEQLTARNEAARFALDDTQQQLRHAQDVLYEMQHSLSWKVTDPLRKLMALIRSGPRQTRK